MKQIVKKEHISEAELIKRGWNTAKIPLYLKAEKNKVLLTVYWLIFTIKKRFFK